KDIAGAGSSTPSGSVTFSVAPSTGGSFTPPNPCALTTVNATTSSCSVTYTPSASGAQTITGVYSGSTTHATSQGQFGLGGGLRSTSTVVSCSPGTVPVNVPSTCTATVTDTNGAGATPPGGSVGFSASG